MLTSNRWAEVGLHKRAKVKVVDIVYKILGGPGPLDTVSICLFENSLEQMLQLQIFFFIDHSSFVNKILFQFRTRGICESSC